MRKAAALAFSSVLLVGCAKSWISSPSPQVAALVKDLTLQGYECDAKTTEIVCREKSVQAVSRPSLCDASRCYKQPDQYRVSMYRIGQTKTGWPVIRHVVEPAAAPQSIATGGNQSTVD